MARTAVQTAPRASSSYTLRSIAATDDHERMVRGLTNAAMLALPIWLAAGYVAFILR